ncbi:MAG: hypothetical protein CMN80_01675 [Spongiibacter sp.]|nr:hypothetical protein [Spongiibacter sp.]
MLMTDDRPSKQPQAGSRSIESWAEFEIDHEGTITRILHRGPIDTLRSLASVSPGDKLRDRLPSAALHSLKSGAAAGVASQSFAATMDGEPLILHLTASDEPAGRFLLTIYPDRLGLSRIQRQQKHLEIISRSLYESSLDAIITIDDKSVIHEFGSSAEQLFGYTREEVVGKHVADIVIPHGMRKSHNEGMANFNKTRQGPVLNTRIEVEAIRRDGSLFPCELTVVPTAEFEGQTFFTATIRDITTRIEREKALTQARETAVASSKAKSSFLAHMSHEIRSPLNAVIGCMDLLLEGDLSTEQRMLAETSLAAGNSLLSVIEDVLDFSKIESGQQEIHSSKFSLLEQCERVMEVSTIRAVNKDIEISACIDPRIPKTVISDLSFVRRIVTNLLDNAIKFTDSGGVNLKISQTDEKLADGRLGLVLEVRDSGVGISEEDQEKLFNEFSQVDNSDSAVHGGTGLGLVICKKLTELLDGRISLTSKKGEGCRFRVEIPVNASNTNLPSLAKPKRATGKLFLRSDNKTLLASILQQADWLGIEAVAIRALENLPKLSARDILIVDMRCFATPEKLSTLLMAQQIPIQQVVLYNRNFSAELLQHSSKAGFQHMMYRPFRPSQLLAILDGDAESEPANEQITDEINPSRHKLLLAEDNEANQLVAKTLLLRAGYQVDIVANGIEALMAVTSGRYDLVLMDLRMPEMDGLEATRHIRQLPGKERNTPIIAMTANAFDTDVKRCEDAGMDGFLSKPVNRDELLNTLECWLPVEQTAASSSQDDVSNTATLTAALYAAEIDTTILEQLVVDTGLETALIILKMVVEQLDKLQSLTAAIADSADQPALAGLRDAVHSAKSNLGYCGATSLQDYCLQIEKCCDAENTQLLMELLSVSGEKFSSGKEALHHAIAELEARSV